MMQPQRPDRLQAHHSCKKIIQRAKKQRDADGDEDVVEAGDQPQPFFIRITCRIAVLDQKFREAVGSVSVEHALGDSGFKLGAAKGEIAGRWSSQALNRDIAIGVNADLRRNRHGLAGDGFGLHVRVDQGAGRGQRKISARADGGDAALRFQAHRPCR